MLALGGLQFVGRGKTMRFYPVEIASLFYIFHTSLFSAASAQSPDLLFNPHRQRMREPIHIKEDLYPIMCDVCELVAYSVYFDTAEKLKVLHIYSGVMILQITMHRRNQLF